jgi:hypothetical protein
MRRTGLPGGDQCPAGAVASALAGVLETEGAATNAFVTSVVTELTASCSTGTAGSSLRIVQQFAFKAGAGAE